MKKYLYLSFIIILSALASYGCKETKTYRIGISQCSQDDWRAKMNDEIKREIMLHENATVEIRSADDSNTKQTEDIRYFADNGFDIIIVSPNEAEALTPVIRDVYESGMPIIIFDRNINDSSYTARIGVDDKGIGSAAAHYAFNILGAHPKAIEITGLPGSTPAENRHDGFVEEFVKGGGHMLASATGKWNKEDAMPIVDSLLNIYDDIDLIYAHNDRMAIGASEIARSKGRANIKIIGIDAAPTIGIKAVADGVIDATFLYPTEGHRLVRTALAILDGEPYERDVQIPASSAVDISNADILLLQNEALVEETSKMKFLKEKIDEYWEKHSSQTFLFYASIAIIILLFGVFFLLLRAYWQHRRHQAELLEQNKLLEQQRDLQASLNEQLKEATQSKLAFFTNVSHDLRTPLTLIAEPVEQLAAADNLTEQQSSLMKIACKNVKILRRLIDQILDFRKYENGKLDLNLSEVDFSQAVNEWLEAFYALARKRHIKLILNENNSAGRTLALDAEKFERVFFNLVSNAFKYTPDNGSITVSYELDAGHLTFKVADTGQGISERDLGKIFDRFYQVDRVHPNGSGIGLSLAKAFIELHGGTISVESVLDKGSEFTVTIPVRHVEVRNTATVKTAADIIETEAETADYDTAFDSEKPLLLIIDDNKDIQRLIAEILGKDYNVINAQNGSDGLRKATRYIPDLIICDVMMPVMDGLECCRNLKVEVSTSHIPVLMLTACSMDEQRVQGYDSGADGYLAKPFNSAVLKSRCHSLLENRRRIKDLYVTAAPVSGRKKTDSAQATPTSDIDNDFYHRFLDIFRAEMGNPDISVDSIASKMGFERTQLYRKLKALTNYAPVELMRRIRLEEARSQLLATDRTISEIAYGIGFSTPAYFTKCYRDAYGETPSETRSKLSGKQ